MIVPLLAGGVLVLAMSAAPSVGAQTPFGGKGQVPATPPPKAGTPAPAQTSPAQAPVGGGQAHVSADMRQQAEFQAEGVFPEMRRPEGGGQIQDAWNLSEERNGYHVAPLCHDCVYKVRGRIFMATTLILPPDAAITSVDGGDDVGFQIKVKDRNKLAIRPTKWGVDTNFNVYTKSGAVYPFYVRSETVNSMNVPDLVFRIDGREKPGGIEVLTVDAGGIERQEKEPLATAEGMAIPAPPVKDFIRHVPLDPDKFHGWSDYKLWGDAELKPEIVYRDDFFTYIKFGKKWDGMELGTGYVTIDGIDDLVNTSVQGTTFVVESVAPLITLKLGNKYLCIQYTGKAS